MEHRSRSVFEIQPDSVPPGGPDAVGTAVLVMLVMIGALRSSGGLVIANRPPGHNTTPLSIN
jgi:hypothetical protein